MDGAAVPPVHDEHRARHLQNCRLAASRTSLPRSPITFNVLTTPSNVSVGTLDSVVRCGSDRGLGLRRSCPLRSVVRWSHLTGKGQKAAMRHARGPGPSCLFKCAAGRTHAHMHVGRTVRTTEQGAAAAPSALPLQVPAPLWAPGLTFDLLVPEAPGEQTAVPVFFLWRGPPRKQSAWLATNYCQLTVSAQPAQLIHRHPDTCILSSTKCRAQGRLTAQSGPPFCPIIDLSGSCDLTYHLRTICTDWRTVGRPLCGRNKRSKPPLRIDVIGIRATLLA
ncbi:hypothetical protein B0T26DRAFT_721438 [Lasiosphaeria miniovina]|uniref:Uncharacterized protein n=1 Tax=Lasiosphaeria miniovina TaxID=1954250 RepID=A0AA40A537_9PEZI|nr:uncharacterized protein B0T26DRAFT_721438 [Lasiosphaeria miniovina]KAK0709420.1 hypothetical protein B0T26DRAFT_721438 [Lasiosphaeria miniovina]